MRYVTSDLLRVPDKISPIGPSNVSAAVSLLGCQLQSYELPTTTKVLSILP